MENVGVYVHVPFCGQKCRYCDFPSWAGMGEEQISRYFDALCGEIQAFGKKYGRQRAITVYFGGGTPSFVNPACIARTVACLKDSFSFAPECEMTIEANPGTVTAEKARIYRELGFNRVSLGLQTTQDPLLKTLGRIHTYAVFQDSLSILRAAGFTNLSADLMFGLPGQTLEDVAGDVDRLARLEGIQHVSCYSLKIEEGTAFEQLYREGKLVLPEETLEREMQHLIIRRLAAEGFGQYEISNFAKKGYESRHNSLYWVMAPYVGFGLGAASYYKEARRTNVMDMETYCVCVEQGKPPVLEVHVLDTREKKGDFMFLGLRQMAGVCDTDYRDMFGTSFFEDFEGIGGLVKQGLLEQQGTVLRLTPRGQDLANQVFVEFV